MLINAAIVEEQMRKDNETTASQVHVLLVSLGYRLNLRTILHCRTGRSVEARIASSYVQFTCRTSFVRYCRLKVEHLAIG